MCCGDRLIVAASLYAWKRRAPAHERAARDSWTIWRRLHGRVAGGRRRTPQVPAWVTAFHVANLGLVIYSNMEAGHNFRSGGVGLVYFLIFCYWTGIRTSIDWIAPGNPVWGHVGADAFILFACFQRSWKADDIDISVKGFLCYLPLLGACVNTHEAMCWLEHFAYGPAPDAERAARELLDAEAEREATTRARPPQRGARPGLRKRANRGRRRDAAPRASEPDPPTEPDPPKTTKTAAPEPKTPEPEPEPEPTRATDVQETVLEPTAPEPRRAGVEGRAGRRARTPARAGAKRNRVAPISRAGAGVQGRGAPRNGGEESAAAPEGFEIVARVLEHLNEPHLLPIFVAEEINDNVLPCLDPSDLIGLGVSQMTCLTDPRRRALGRQEQKTRDGGRARQRRETSERARGGAPRASRGDQTASDSRAARGPHVSHHATLTAQV